MKICRIIIGAIFIFIAVGLFFGFFAFGLAFLIFGFLFLVNKFSTFSILTAFLGTIAILGGIIAAPYELTIPVIGIIETIIVLLVGILAILPLKFYEKSFVRKISYLSPIVLIFLFIFYYIFFFKLSPRGEFAGDFSIILMWTFGSLLLGSLCVPALIAKSILSRKS